MPLIRRPDTQNRNNMLPTVSLVRLPEMTKNKSNEDRNRTDENVKQFCANCGLQDNSIVHMMVVDMIIPQQVNFNFGQPNYEKKRVVMDVNTALSSIYKLDCLKKFPPDEDDILKNNDEPMVICKSCSTVLIPLYKLLQEFNILRSMDSILQQKILKFDSRLDKILQNGIKEEPDSDEDFNPELEESQLRDEEMDQHSDFNANNNDDDDKLPQNFLSVEMSTGENTSDELQQKDTPTKDDDYIPQSIKNPLPTTTTRRRILILQKRSVIPSTSSPISIRKNRVKSSRDFSQKNRCPLCKEVKTSPADLLQHIFLGHAAPGSSTCPLCKRVLIRRMYLKEHISTHLGYKPHSCPSCDSTFRKFWELKNHCASLHPDKNIQPSSSPSSISPPKYFQSTNEEDGQIFSCPKCHKKFLSRRNHSAHIKICKGPLTSSVYKTMSTSPPKSLLTFKPSIIDDQPESHNNYSCSLCPSTFHTKVDLSDHIYTEHVEKNKTLPSTSCPLCLKKYPSDPSKLKPHILFTHAEAGAGSLECPTCHKKFYRSCNLARHIQGHVAQSSRVELRCDVCGQKMGSQAILKIHMKRHAGDFQFPCPFPGCTKSYVAAYELKTHEQRKHSLDKNAFICETCGKGFPVQRSLNVHMKSVHHKDSLFPCPSCPHRLYSQAALDKHLKEYCSKEKPKFICDECGKIYKSTTALQIHLRFHAGDALICPHPDCGKKFYDKHILNAHLRLHDEGSRFKCPAPGCNHVSATNLNLHVQAKHPELVEDAEDKSQLCPVCGIKILGDYRLKKHLAVVHSDRSHECESCGKKFKTVHALHEHKKIHGGEKPFHCEWPGCNKSFLYDQHLKKHMRTHTGEKSYECQDCGKKFSDGSNLKKHSLIHSEGTFNCSVCERVFKQPQSLKTHMTTHGK